MDLEARRAHSDSLTLTGVKLLTWLEPDGSVNLLKLAAMPATATPAPRRSGEPARSLEARRASCARRAGDANAAPAKMRVPRGNSICGEFALRDASISAEDRGTKPAAKVLLAPLSLKVDGVSLDLAKPVTVALDTQINDTGSLNVDGRSHAAAPGGQFDPEARRHRADRGSTLHRAVHLDDAARGRLGGDAKVRYGAQKPALQFSGNSASPICTRSTMLCMKTSSIGIAWMFRA